MAQSSSEKAMFAKNKKTLQLKKLDLEGQLEKHIGQPNFDLRKDIAQMELQLLKQQQVVAEETDPARKKELQSFVPVLQDTIKELKSDL